MTIRRAFTLIELLVVIAIIGLLSTVAVVATTSAQINARNTKRKADLIQISKALELYYNDNGSYPVTTGWRGNCAYGPYPDTDPGSWIPGLVSGGYMARLPRDPRQGQPNVNAQDVYCKNNPANNCYIYNSNGTDYALLAYCTPEGTWTSSDPFYCSIIPACSVREWRVVSQVNATTNNWY